MPRISKINKSGLAPYIEKLRAEGMVLQKICEVVNAEYPDIHLTQNDCSRHLKSLTKKKLSGSKMSSSDTLTLLRTRLLNELDRCSSIKGGDKQALRRTITEVWKVLNEKERNSSKIIMDVDTEVDKQMNAYLTQIADKTSWKCKCEIRDILKDIYGISGAYHLYKESYPQVPDY